MMEQLLKYGIYILCTVGFIIQMLSVICNLMFPKNSVTEISDVNLGDKHHIIYIL